MLRIAIVNDFLRRIGRIEGGLNSNGKPLILLLTEGPAGDYRGTAAVLPCQTCSLQTNGGPLVGDPSPKGSKPTLLFWRSSYRNLAA